VETTGLDAKTDEVIEVGMVKFAYCPDGRKYRWNDGGDGRPRSWHIEIDEDLLDAEMRFLRQEIYRRDVELFTQSITALTRFSDRS
jgi:hypothetical protein